MLHSCQATSQAQQSAMPLTPIGYAAHKHHAIQQMLTLHSANVLHLDKICTLQVMITGPICSIRGPAH